MKKRILCILVVLLLAFAPLTACKKPKGEIGRNDPATLKMWGGGTQWKGEYSQQLLDFIDDFNKGKLGEESKKLNLTIEIELVDSVEEVISTTIQDEEYCPNIMVWDRFSTPTYAYQEYLLPIDDYIKEVDTTKFSAEAYKELGFYMKGDSTKARKQFGLPIDVDPWGVYINMNVITAHNDVLNNDTTNAKYVDPARFNNDWTWFDVLDIAKRLSGETTGKKVYGFSAGDMQQHFFKYMVSTGVDFIVDHPTQADKLLPNVQNQQGRDVLAFFKALKDANITKGNVENIDFVQGTVAMLNQATYYGSYIKKTATAPLDYKFLPQPKYSGWTDSDNAVKTGAVNGGMIGGFGLAIPKLSDALLKNPGTKAMFDSYALRSMDFMKWWAYGEGAKYWAQYTETLPALTALYDDQEVMKSVVQISAKEYVGNYKIRDNVRKFQDFQKSGINAQVEAFLKTAGSVSDQNKTLKDIAEKGTYYLAK